MEGRARAWGRRIELSLRCARLRKWAPLVAAAAALGPPPLPEPTRDTVNPPCLCTWLHPWARACTEPEGGSDLGDGLHGGGRVLRPCGGHAAAPLLPSDGWSLRCKRSSGASAGRAHTCTLRTSCRCGGGSRSFRSRSSAGGPSKCCSRGHSPSSSLEWPSAAGGGGKLSEAVWYTPPWCAASRDATDAQIDTQIDVQPHGPARHATRSMGDAREIQVRCNLVLKIDGPLTKHRAVQPALGAVQHSHGFRPSGAHPPPPPHARIEKRIRPLHAAWRRADAVTPCVVEVEEATAPPQKRHDLLSPALLKAESGAGEGAGETSEQD